MFDDFVTEGYAHLSTFVIPGLILESAPSAVVYKGGKSYIQITQYPV